MNIKDYSSGGVREKINGSVLPSGVTYKVSIAGSSTTIIDGVPYYKDPYILFTRVGQGGTSSYGKGFTFITGSTGGNAKTITTLVAGSSN